jgi:hypothetical protein
LDAHDLVIAKLMAMREKDVTYTGSLVRARLIDLDTLSKRLDLLPASVPPEKIDYARTLIAGWSHAVGDDG